MSQQIIQINFQFKGSNEEFSKTAATVATVFAQLPGLQWKIWLLNEERKEAGGVYLFADEQTASDYLQSDIFRMVSTNPKYVHFSAKQFSTLDIPGFVTRAPMGPNLSNDQFNQTFQSIHEIMK